MKARRITFDSADTENICAVCGKRIDPHAACRVIGGRTGTSRRPSYLLVYHPGCPVPSLKATP